MFEINLVPDLKVAVLKSQRVRNIVFIVCVFVMIAVGVIVVTLGSIKISQDVRINDQTTRLKLLSNKINDYPDLNTFLTIQDQLNKLSEIENTKVDYSRIFNFIDILPSGINYLIRDNEEFDDLDNKDRKGDEELLKTAKQVAFSEMRFDFSNFSLSFRGKLDDKTEDDSDFNKMEAFEKSVEYLRFDYGVYKDEKGFEIPSVCILEVDKDGQILEEDDRMYAIWTRGVSGCDPEDEGETVIDKDGSEKKTKTEVVNIKIEDVEAARKRDLVEADAVKELEDDDKSNVRIWRTPLFKEWYGNEDDSEDHMRADGTIYGIAHFESECIKYEITANKWNTSNDCNLVIGEMNVSSKTSAKEGDRRVVSFNASLNINPEALYYKNKHAAFVAYGGYMNVTDSKLIMDDIFKPPVIDCSGSDSCAVNNREGNN